MAFLVEYGADGDAQKQWRLHVGSQYLLGRHETNCGVCIPHFSVSRKHASLRVLSGSRDRTTLEITELGGVNGTFLDGKKVRGARVCSADSGIEILFGDCPHTYKFVSDGVGVSEVCSPRSISASRSPPARAFEKNRPSDIHDSKSRGKDDFKYRERDDLKKTGNDCKYRENNHKNNEKDDCKHREKDSKCREKSHKNREKDYKNREKDYKNHEKEDSKSRDRDDYRHREKTRDIDDFNASTDLKRPSSKSDHSESNVHSIDHTREKSDAKSCASVDPKSGSIPSKDLSTNAGESNVHTGTTSASTKRQSRWARRSPSPSACGSRYPACSDVNKGAAPTRRGFEPWDPSDFVENAKTDGGAKLDDKLCQILSGIRAAKKKQEAERQAMMLMQQNAVVASQTSGLTVREKRKLLWGGKKKTDPQTKDKECGMDEAEAEIHTQVEGGATLDPQDPNHYAYSFNEDVSKKTKFLKLMGFKGVPTDLAAAPEVNVQEQPHLDKEFTETLNTNLEMQYYQGIRRKDGRKIGLGF